MPDPDPLVVPCPTCRQRGTWFAAPWGPFCSQRCRLIDLGQWFNEEHRISRPLRPGDFAGFEELPPGPELDRTAED
jgi:endogenous inhibitor of DNA gyrase (YacG/DUF329 family)